MTLKWMVRFSLLTVMCVGSRLHAQQPDAARLAVQVCASCHGAKGRSTSPAFPRLAGQRQEYLDAQLKAFRDRTRADPMAQAYMWGMTSQLTDGMIAKLATYFSEQAPVLGKTGDPKLVEAGRAIFEQGLPSANVPACLTCHGKAAEGNAIVPRLAGQHPEYLLKQLVMFKSELRAGASAPIMHAITTGLTFDQMLAVSAYLTSRPRS
jgi:cytochrome c553